jgi:FKBP-type peptidyl-prolyl cis-trans isomerase FkpA
VRKRRILLSVWLIAFSSCQKDPGAAQQAAIDDAVIQEFINTNHINATKDPSGLYYSVLNSGNGISPGLSSTVTVTYTGFVINGNYIATNLKLSSELNSLIRGWQIGLPHIKTGGTIILLIPSALGYGNSTPQDMPNNSSLVYNIVLNNVSN